MFFVLIKILDNIIDKILIAITNKYLAISIGTYYSILNANLISSYKNHNTTIASVFELPADPCYDYTFTTYYYLREVLSFSTHLVTDPFSPLWCRPKLN